MKDQSQSALVAATLCFGLSLMIALPLAASGLATNPGAGGATVRQQPRPTFMPKTVSLGRSKTGFSARMTIAHVDDENYNPFYLQVLVEGKEFLGLKSVRFEVDERSFQLDLPPGSEVRNSGLRIPEPPSNAELSLTLKEDRTFPLPLENARWLAAADEVKVLLRGSSDRQSEHRLRTKALAKVREWLEPRIP